MTELEVLKQENARLRDALEFYADYNNYNDTFSKIEDRVIAIKKISIDHCGDIARKALKFPHDGKDSEAVK